ncbi:hypothetical protein D9M72_82820 [compost metagenome]
MKPEAYKRLFFGLSRRLVSVCLSPRRYHFISRSDCPLMRGLTRLNTSLQSASEKLFTPVGGCSLGFDGGTECIKQLDHMCGQSGIIGIQVYHWHGFGKGICLRQVLLEPVQRGWVHLVGQLQLQRGLIDFEFGKVQRCKVSGGYECRFVRPSQRRRFLGVQGNPNRNDGSKKRGQGTGPLNDDWAAQEGFSSNKKDTGKEGHDEYGQKCGRPWCRLHIHASYGARPRSLSFHSIPPSFELCDRNVTETEGESA